MAAKFTQKVEQYLQAAAGMAQEEQHQQLSPIHLAIVMFEDPEGMARQAVVKASGEEAWKSICRILRKRLVRLPKVEPAPDELYPSKEFSAVLKRAQKEQKHRQDTYIGVDVLLLALLSDPEVAAAVAEAGVTKSAIEAALKEARPKVSGTYHVRWYLPCHIQCFSSTTLPCKWHVWLGVWNIVGLKPAQ